MTEKREIKDIFSKKVKAGRRTYFFDVRETKASDYYMTLTESVRDFNEDGAPTYRKHKIYLYKEDFANFKEAFEDVSNFIIAEKGEEIISNKKFEKREETPTEKKEESSTEFTEVNFDDLGKD
ncbi:PUR family DNA/RNA-binding protein [Flavobacteriales bacterium]|jgi:hypothetical protein|nr:PUR family DNA/RNA-binding protein [Flavobacteriales bacterium]